MNRKFFTFVLLTLLFLTDVCSQNMKNQDILDIDGTEVAFQKFKTKFGKSYSSKEQVASRKANFQKNMNLLKTINCSTCSVTAYFDRSDQELENMRGAKFEIQTSPPLAASTPTTGAVTANLATLDWRINKRLTAVKDQGSCGSCWAFAVTAFFQSEVVRTKGLNPSTVNLAEQFLLKCDTTSKGCSGGYITTATQLAISKGLPVESRYPYNPKTTYAGICKSTPDFTFSGAKTVPYSGSVKLSDDQIITYLQTRPIMIAVTATYWYMYSFSTTPTYQCRSQESTSASTLNHAVLLVGYNDKYWIIKNSWGTAYGDGGFIYISRTTTANCGIGFSILTLA